MVTSHIRKSIGKVTSFEMPASSSWSTYIIASEFKRLLSGLWCQASLHSVLWDRQLMAPHCCRDKNRIHSDLQGRGGFLVIYCEQETPWGKFQPLTAGWLWRGRTPHPPPLWIIFPQTLLTDVVMMSESGISQSMNFFFELLWEVVLRLWKSSKTAAHEINSRFFSPPLLPKLTQGFSWESRKILLTKTTVEGCVRQENQSLFWKCRRTGEGQLWLCLWSQGQQDGGARAGFWS